MRMSCVNFDFGGKTMPRRVGLRRGSLHQGIQRIDERGFILPQQGAVVYVPS
jgi:hypothetical protein